MIVQPPEAMMGKPVIVSVDASGPMFFAEFEREVDEILYSFGVQDKAFLEIISGTEPSGLLPVQMPADMKTVELQHEDVPHVMEVYKDTAGTKYDFALTG